MIRLEGIERQFGPQVLFDGLSWTIQPQSRVGLVGPNGAGKTTLLRMITGQDRPDGGSVQKPNALRIGYLSQEVETIEGGSVLNVVLAGFPEVRTLEDRLAELEREMSRLTEGDEQLAGMTERYGELRQQFEALGGDEVEARARAILSGLGVTEDLHHADVEKLSGGWRMRVVLAGLLLGEPGVLLLDEPTNHLDLEAIDWLEQFLDAYEGAFVVVSHDRYFLNRMVREVVELDRGVITRFPGSYDNYLTERAEREERLEAAAKQQAKERAKVERFIERFRYKNTKAKQVQSRIKALEKQETIHVESRGGSVRFGFPPAPRSGDIAVRIEDLAKSYGDNEVYRSLNLMLRRGERIALMGPNGAGKSTLLKMLAGKVDYDDGELELGHNVVRRYYAQHQLDELDAEATVLEEMESVAPLDLRPRLRSMLGSFLFKGEAVEKRVGVLSGGEKARLALCKLLVRPMNLLLLDEPTNHLDLPSREVLEEALNQYEGTLVLISHDRYFINRVATSIAIVGGGRAEVHPGDYDSYVEWKRWRASQGQPVTLDDTERPDQPVASSTPAEKQAARQKDKESRRLEAEERNRRYRERKAREEQLGPVEQEIQLLESRIETLTARQADPEVYSNPEAAAEIGKELADAESKLAELYERWEALAEAFPE
ncbi:hypothetical protein ABI59_08275 [Acidobacteria bacterium Mor1]|nr:hypothetical protein ABI59_08275 [Acidobacteria bacterium Mor1]